MPKKRAFWYSTYRPRRKRALHEVRDCPGLRSATYVRCVIVEPARAAKEWRLCRRCQGVKVIWV